MPSRKTVEAFVAMVEKGQFDTAMERYYAADASMQENLGAPRTGLDVLVAGERGVMARYPRVEARCIRPVMISDDQVAIRWLFTFTLKDGTTRTLDEIACQRWSGEKMQEERFYYDPKQMQGW
jgi:hypothetical protein